MGVPNGSCETNSATWKTRLSRFCEFLRIRHESGKQRAIFRHGENSFARLRGSPRRASPGATRATRRLSTRAPSRRDSGLRTSAAPSSSRARHESVLSVYSRSIPSVRKSQRQESDVRSGSYRIVRRKSNPFRLGAKAVCACKGLAGGGILPSDFRMERPGSAQDCCLRVRGCIC